MYFLLRYFVRNDVVTEVENVCVILYVLVLDACYAASVIAVFSVIVESITCFRGFRCLVGSADVKIHDSVTPKTSY